jgi:hypothetical protein
MAHATLQLRASSIKNSDVGSSESSAKRSDRGQELFELDLYVLPLHTISLSTCRDLVSRLTLILIPHVPSVLGLTA